MGMYADLLIVGIFEHDLGKEPGAHRKWVAFRSTNALPAR